MQNIIKAATCAIVLLAAAAVSQAAIIVYATDSDYKPEPGASLTDVQLTVDMKVKDGVATFSFLNSSKRPETSVSFKEIVLDGHAQLSDTKVLWAPAALTDTWDVGYTAGDSAGVPGHKIEDDVNMLGLFAKSPSPKKGINPGETLMVSFKTSLADGSDIYDYVSMFHGQSDYVIGFHGISADIINGQSLTGVLRPEVPEPAITAILAVGAAILLRRRNK